MLILGASGFIGSHLTRYVAGKKHDCIALCRSGAVNGHAGSPARWELGEAVPPQLARGVDCAIHLAHDFSGEKGAALTVHSTVATVEQLCNAGVGRQLFFSSCSASDMATSLYGKTKRAIELGIQNKPGVVIVRPGLVLGNGGLYGRMQNFVKKFPLVPLPDGGYGKLPVITIEKLCRGTLRLATMHPAPPEANLFEKELSSMRGLVLEIAAENNKHPVIINMPSAIIRFLLSAGEFIHLPLPVTKDNLDGFMANQYSTHQSSLSD
jgi:uncharacterized protein YbjT (DUF2867 family)